LKIRGDLEDVVIIKSVPIWIPYLHKFSQIFIPFLSIFPTLEMDFREIFNLENLPRQAHLSVPSSHLAVTMRGSIKTIGIPL
jgi:hypothetical protein